MPALRASSAAGARFTYFILRAGAAFAFLYPAVNAWFEPFTWLGYVPPFALSLAHSLGLSDMVFLHAFGAVEIIIALWVLSGKKIFWPAALATIMLLAIVAVNLQDFEVLFRDLSIAALTLGLAMMNVPQRHRGI